MKKKNLYVIYLFLSTVFICTYGQEKVGGFIEGTIKGWGNKEVILANNSYFPIDTVKAVNGHFSFKHDFDLSDPKRYLIYLPAVGGFSPKMVFFFIDSKKIVISGEMTKENNLNKIIVKGSPITDEYNTLEAGFPSTSQIEKYKKLQAQREKLLFRASFLGLDAYDLILTAVMRYDEILYSLANERKQEIVDAIPPNDKSIAMTYIVYDTYNYRDPSYTLELKKALSCFAPELKNTYYLQSLHKKLKKMKPVSVGAVAPDFVLQDAAGRATKLSSLRGNYVLLYFWSSQDMFYGTSLLETAKAYNRFSNKGFKVLALSGDNDKNQWLDAIKKAKTPYKQLWDEKRAVGKLYQSPSTSTSPYCVLIAPDGTIARINEGLKGKALIKTLETLYSQ